MLFILGLDNLITLKCVRYKEPWKSTFKVIDTLHLNLVAIELSPM